MEYVFSRGYADFCGHSVPGESDDESIDRQTRFLAIDGPTIIAYVTELFERSGELLRGLTREQIDDGFHLIVNNSCSNYLQSLKDPKIPIADRLRCVNAIKVVYRDVFAPVYGDVTARNRTGQERPPFSCNMWWDVFCFHGQHRSDPDLLAISEACLGVMADALTLPSDACVESALHGLGHWHCNMSREVERVIDGFLHQRPDVSPGLREYATSARAGNVL
jgi:hypothetical protein